MVKTAWIALLTVCLSGCASDDGRGLVIGQSTESEVEALMGPSLDRRPGPNGDTVRYYSRLPYGRAIYAARFAPDGKLKALEQRLQEEYLKRLKTDASSKDDVRDILGPPLRSDFHGQPAREIWTYPWQGLMSDQILFVQFSADGILRELFLMDDPDAIAPE